MPHYNDNYQHDSATALYDLINSLDNSSKQLIEYNMNISQTCPCKKRCYAGNNIHSLELQIGWLSHMNNIPFNMLLERWMRHASANCNECKQDKIIQNEVTIPPQQRYLILEINRFNVQNNGANITQYENNITYLNEESQQFFKHNWKLIAATEYKGYVRNGHYVYWKKLEKSWAVVDDNKVSIYDKLNEGLRGYRYFIFEKL
uniref:USP domain-containing protein n=1 Tax=Panagrolaimus superbus TaxID=310955 RepID=A0A914YY85_9BILA